MNVFYLSAGALFVNLLHYLIVRAYSGTNSFFYFDNPRIHLIVNYTILIILVLFFLSSFFVKELNDEFQISCSIYLSYMALAAIWIRQIRVRSKKVPVSEPSDS